MKIYLLIFLIIILTSCVGGGGTAIVQDEVDAFTGHRIKKTTFERASNHYAMSPSMFNFIGFKKIDNSYVLDLKTTLVSGAVFAIDKDDQLMMKLRSGEILKLNAIEHKISCSGCGAEGTVHSGVQGLLQSYPIMPKQIKKLSEDPPVLIRLYLTTGYIEEPVPAEEASNIGKIATLILQ